MFASRIAITQTKAAERPTGDMAARRSTGVAPSFATGAVEQMLTLQRSIGNQATLSFLTRLAPRSAAREPSGDQGQAVARENIAEAPRPAAALPGLLAGVLQPNLAIGSVDDPLEHEADRVADHVIGIADPGAAMTPAPPQVSRKCAACGEEEKLQKSEAGPQAAVGEALASVYEVLRSPGQPLDAATRAYFEPRFGRDFSSVRVHIGPSAAQSARDVKSHAYTVGQNIAFDSGRFAPGSQEGRRLLAHELTHVVQQRGLGAIGDQASLRRLLPPVPPCAGGNALVLRRQPADEPDEPLDAALARQDTMDRIAEDARKLGEQLDAAGVDIAESDAQAAPFFVREAPEVQRIQQQIAAGRAEAPARLAKLQSSLTLAAKAYLTEADDLDELRKKIAFVEALNSFTPALLRDTTEYEALLRQQKTGESDLADNIAFIEGIRRQIEITRRFLPERAAYLAQRSRLLETQATFAAQKAGVKTDTRASLGQLDLLRTIIEASPTLSPYLTAQRAQGAEPTDLRNQRNVTIHASQSDLEDKARATGIAVPPPPRLIGGFYDRATDTIYLPPEAQFGDALHESVHKYSPTFVANPGHASGRPANLVTSRCGSFLNEGLTQYFADIILTDQGLQKSTHHQYQQQLACATRFVRGFQSGRRGPALFPG